MKRHIFIKRAAIIVLGFFAAIPTANAQCVIGQGGATNYLGSEQEMIAFAVNTAKNIKAAIDYLPWQEHEFYSEPGNLDRVTDFDYLVAEGIITLYAGRYRFHVGKFWVSYLPESTGVLVECDPECGLSPII